MPPPNMSLLPPMLDEGVEEESAASVLPQDGIRDMAGRLADAGGADPDEVDELIVRTQMIEEKLRDDPAPEVPFLALPDPEIVRVFEARLRMAASFREPWEWIWKKCWLDYNQKLDGNYDRWKSKVFLPFLYTLVSAGIPQSVAAAFDSGEIFKVIAQGPEDEDNAETVQRLLDWFVRVKIPARREIRDWLWFAYLYGTGVMRVGWRYETRLMRVPTPVYEDDPYTGEKRYLGTKLAQKVVTTHDEPDLVCVDLWNAFLCPWTTRSDHRIPYMIERMETTEEDLLACARAGSMGPEGERRVEEWLGKRPVLDLDEGNVYSALGTRSLALQEIGLASPYELVDSDDNADPGAKPVVLYAYHTREAVVVLSGDGSRTVLGKQPNPYLIDDLPYVLFHFDRIPGCPYGKGMGQIAGPIQSQINFDFNHHNDSRRLRLNAPMKVRRLGNSLVEGDLEMKPGKLIRVREMDDVQPVEIPDTTGDMVTHQQLLMDHANKATGVNDVARGFSQPGANTATEASILDAYTSLRRSEHTSELKEALKQIARRMIRLCQQFVTKDLAIKVAGAPGLDWQTISPEKILGEFDVIPSASLTKSNPELLRRDWSVLYPMLAANPLVKQDELLRRVLAVYEQERPEELLQQPPPPPRDPMDEEIALDLGQNVPVSPDEDFRAHLEVHAMKVAMLKQEPVPDTRAIQAHVDHINATYEMMAMVQQAQMLGGGPGAPAPAGGGAPGGGPPAQPPGNGSGVRDKATRLGEGQGSFGRPGQSPGPAGVPGRATKRPA